MSSASAEWETAHIVLTSNPAQLPLSVSFRAQLEDNTEAVEAYAIHLYLNDAIEAHPAQ